MKSRATRITAAIIGALLVFVVLLPTLISSNPIRQRILKRINHKLPGELHLRAWSLHWFGSQQFEQLAYRDAATGLRLEVRRVRISKGLLALLISRSNWGSVGIENPVLTVTRTAAGKKGAAASGRQYTATEPQSRPPTGKKPGPALGAAANLKMRLSIAQGRILLSRADGKPVPLAQALKLDLVTAGAGHPVSCRVAFSAAGSSGRMSATVDLPRGLQAQTRPETLALAATVAIHDWPLEKLLPLAALTHTAGLQGSGRLQADIRVDGSLLQGMRSRGRIAADDLQLSGGALGTDRPHFKHAAASFDILAGRQKVEISRLDLTADGIEAHATGQVTGPQQTAFNGRLDLELARLAALFPSTLHLQKGLTLSAGHLNAVVDLNQSAAGIRFQGQTSVKGLAGSRAGRRIVLKSPFLVSAKGRRDTAGLHIDDFALKSAYIKGDGRGDLGNLQLHLSADVRPAIGELKQFIRLEKLDAGGRLKLSLATRSTGKENRRMTVRADASDFHLKYAGTALIPKQRMKIDAAADLQLDASNHPQALQQVEIHSVSWLGDVRLRAKHLRCVPGRLQITGFNVNARLKLSALAALLHQTQHLPGNIDLNGRATLLTAGDIEDLKLTLAKFNIDARRFRLRQGKKRFKSARLTVAARGHMDFKKRSLKIPRIDIGMDSAHVRLKDIAIANWQRPADTLQAGTFVQADLKPFLAALAPWLNLAKAPVFSGHAVLSATATHSRPDSNDLELNLKLAPITAISKGRMLFSQKRMVLTAAASRRRTDHLLTIKHLKLDSQLLSLNTAGTLSDTADRRVLRLKGSLRPNLARLAPYAAELAGFKLVMTGNRETVFDLQTVLPGKEGWQWQAALKKSRLKTTLQADTVGFMGLDLRALKAPLRLQDGHGSANLEATLNTGRLHLAPQFDLSATPAVLSIPDNAAILSAVRLNRTLADQLLSHVHPIFKDVSAISGSMDLTLAHFNWPLTQPAGRDAVFSGSIWLKDVALVGSGFLSAVTQVLGIDTRRLEIGQQRIDFSAQNGRITTSPIKITIRGHEVVLAGSIDMDQRLEYTARAPVTRRLVGKEAYRYLEGATINLPIRGTLSHPRVSTGSVADAVKDLMRQSVKKSLEQNAGKLLEKLFK